MFYVYELIDPRDGKPFYVGKGKGDGTPNGLGNLVEDVRLARGLRKIAAKTANFTRFPKFLRLGGELHPLGACYVLPFALMRDKLLKRRGPEWVANYIGIARA